LLEKEYKGGGTPKLSSKNAVENSGVRLKKIFTQVVELLVQEGVLSIKNINVEGTKIEATSNRYTFVWGNAIKTNKEKIKKQLEELWQYTQKLADEEDQDTTPPDFTTISHDKVEQAIEKIDQALHGNEKVSKAVKQKLNYAKNKWPEVLTKYEAQEKILDGRNSYSKTDPGERICKTCRL